MIDKGVIFLRNRLKENCFGVFLRCCRQVLVWIVTIIVYAHKNVKDIKPFLDETAKSSVDYRDWLRGKRVAIVGPASTLQGLSLGELIDSYDVVVRLNASLPLNAESLCDYGARTDILYHCMIEKGGREFWQLVDGWGLRFICSSFPNKAWGSFQNNMDYYMKNAVTPFRLVGRDAWHYLSKQINGKPTSGISAIVDLLSLEIESLFVGGFSFYQTGYRKGYHNKSPDVHVPVLFRCERHMPSAEFEFFKSEIISDPRVRLDPYLEALCKGDC